MDATDRDGGRAVRLRRADARRNEDTLLDAAASVFVAKGVEAPLSTNERSSKASKAARAMSR